MARYRLRAGLRVVRDDAGRLLVDDAALRRRLRLGVGDGRFLQRLAEGASWAALVSHEGGDEAAAARRLSALARLYLLDGARSQQRLRLAQSWPMVPANEPLLWLQGLDPPRHACVGTGRCCGATFLGPLTGRDRVRVEALSLAARGPRSGGELTEELEFDGKTYVGMAREGGHCVAQRDDGLCEIHADHGAATKAVPCRQFPLRFHRSPRGVHVSLLLACHGYDRARASAEPWAAREAEVRGLLEEGAEVRAIAWPPTWTAGLPVDANRFYALQDAMVARGDAHRAPATSELALTAVAWLRDAVAQAQIAGDARAGGLAEGPHVSTPLRLGGILPLLASAEAAAGDAHTITAAAAALEAPLRMRAQQLEAAGEGVDAVRLARLAASLGRLAAGQDAAMPFAAEAQVLLRDLVADELPIAVAVGPLDDGLAVLAARLCLTAVESRHLARARSAAEVVAGDVTEALALTVRSDADVAAWAGAVSGTLAA